MNDPYATITSALKARGLRRQGSDWQCPAHDDGTPSLSVSRGRTQPVVLHCHGGCTHQQVLEALGLDQAAIMAPAAPTGDIEYVYTDEDGRPLYRVTRSPGKSFRQARFDYLAQDWIGGTGCMEGVRRVPFQLPQVIRAAKAGEVVYVVEGEKDALRAAAAGVTATCNPAGAEMWDKHGHAEEAAAALEGAAGVVIVQDIDDDNTGHKHAVQVAGSLARLRPGLPVRVVQAKVGKDLSDHLDAGHTLEELVPVALAGDASGDVTRFLDAALVQPVPTRLYWDGFLVRGASALLAADGGMGKSTLCCELAAMVTAGLVPPGGPGYDGPRGAVIVSTEEDGPRVIVPRLIQAGAEMARVRLLHVGTDGGFLLPRDEQLLAEAMREVDAGLVFLDTGTDVLEGSETDTQDVGRFFACLNRVADELDCVVLVLHHLNKDDTSPVWEDRIRGISGWKNKPRTVLVIGEPNGEKPSASSDRVLASGVKSNLIRTQRALHFTIEARPMDALGDGAIAPLGAALGTVEADYDADQLLRVLRDRKKQDQDEERPAVTAAVHLKELLEAAGGVMRTVELRGACSRTFGDSNNAMKEGLAFDWFESRQDIPGGKGKGFTRLLRPAPVPWPQVVNCPECGTSPILDGIDTRCVACGG